MTHQSSSSTWAVQEYVHAPTPRPDEATPACLRDSAVDRVSAAQWVEECRQDRRG